MSESKPATRDPIPIDDYDYELPEELIAQEPLHRRDASRLMVLHRDSGAIEHRAFPDLLAYIGPGDLLVINDTRVLPARLRARRATGGAVEILLLRDLGNGEWESLIRRARRLKPGERLTLERRDGSATTGYARVMALPEEGIARVWLAPIVVDNLAEFGDVPLPPYIQNPASDPERYQTVYARESGSAAAPTAGLHFTPELLDAVRCRGARVATVTLHVGAGTFLPVKVEDARTHTMHAETFIVPASTLSTVRKTRQSGRRVIAVGSTSCRSLESVADSLESSQDIAGETGLYIMPGYRFRVVDALITNFHLPRSTLLLMVSAFAGRDLVLSAYREAVERRYRFFSFGDAMLIL
jgi:S-adenosylmethionine:tRNA ribosyltransferase-isomerase